MYDYLIVGAGLYGATFAHEAKAAGKSVLVIDKRSHIGGNVYTENIEGINVHRYGAHIFHTNNKEVWDFVSRFAGFNNYINSPKANYKGELYSLPFNMNTFKEMWGVETAQEAKAEIDRQRSEIKGEPKNLEEQAISLVGRDIFEKLVKGYTEKQWGRNCKDLPAFIIKRLPVRFTFDNNYFNAKYQGIPIGGYTKMVENMLEGIEVRLCEDYLSKAGDGMSDLGGHLSKVGDGKSDLGGYLSNKEKYKHLAKTVIYTGPIDAYFEYKLGRLEYRSLRFENEVLNTPDFQGNAVINYTDAETPYTRIIEHKWFENIVEQHQTATGVTGGENRINDKNEISDKSEIDDKNEISGKTVISREYSLEWHPGDEPYYPVNDEKNSQLYDKYKALAKDERNVYFGGRLGEYKYYDMDAVIAAALELCARLL
ncbi:MAG: NAD(P)-binding protein [Lachnospiraceae bacterium]|nr:NAD(P)-binding protein [Lachnospiraceae bacterium]